MEPASETEPTIADLNAKVDLLNQKLDWIVNQVVEMGKMFKGGGLMSMLTGRSK